MLTSLLHALLRPGVAFARRLRMRACVILSGLVEGDAAAQAVAREHGLLPLLLFLPRQAVLHPPPPPPLATHAPSSAGQRMAAGNHAHAHAPGSQQPLLPAMDPESEEEEQLAVAALDAVAACCRGCCDNQEAVALHGGCWLLQQLLGRPGHLLDTYAATLRLAAVLCEHRYVHTSNNMNLIYPV